MLWLRKRWHTLLMPLVIVATLIRDWPGMPLTLGILSMFAIVWASGYWAALPLEDDKEKAK